MPKFKVGDVVGVLCGCKRCGNGASRFIIRGTDSDGDFKLNELTTGKKLVDDAFPENILTRDEFLSAVNHAKLKAAHPSRSKRRSTG